MFARAFRAFALVDHEVRCIQVDRVGRADIDASPAIDAGFGDFQCHVRPPDGSISFHATFLGATGSASFPVSFPASFSELAISLYTASTASSIGSIACSPFG